MFKSYYVVWKHKGELSIISLHISFKSYYVVWKPGNPDINESGSWGLNRTMQYGNFGSEFYLEDIVFV